MQSMLLKQKALKNQTFFMTKVRHDFVYYSPPKNIFQIFVSIWLQPKTVIATDKIVSMARDHVNLVKLKFFKMERKLEPIPFAWSCMTSILIPMSFNFKVRAQRTISHIFHFRETSESATDKGVCISNFTMNGMESIQISDKLWIEKGQQKCLGQFLYVTLVAISDWQGAWAKNISYIIS